MQDLEQDLTANNGVKKEGRYTGLKDSGKKERKGDLKWGGFREQQEKIIWLAQVVQAGKWGRGSRLSWEKVREYQGLGWQVYERWGMKAWMQLWTAGIRGPTPGIFIKKGMEVRSLMCLMKIQGNHYLNEITQLPLADMPRVRLTPC